MWESSKSELILPVFHYIIGRKLYFGEKMSSQTLIFSQKIQQHSKRSLTFQAYEYSRFICMLVMAQIYRASDALSNSDYNVYSTIIYWRERNIYVISPVHKEFKENKSHFLIEPWKRDLFVLNCGMLMLKSWVCYSQDIELLWQYICRP